MTYRVTRGLHGTPEQQRTLGEFQSLEHARLFLDATVRRDGDAWADECDTAEKVTAHLVGEIRDITDDPFAMWGEWHDSDFSYPQLYEITVSA